MDSCIVAQSGGPTVAINSSLAGVVNAARKNNLKCYGAVNGILGILNENYVHMTESFPTEESLDILKNTPAMFLGSCRHKLPKYTEDDSSYIKIFDEFKKKNVKAFFYIGGNDSMDTVLKLSEYARSIGSHIRLIGIPKTIDNDLCMTDHTPGFGSAAKYIASSILEISYDTFIYPVKSVTIIEIMGRDAGWLTASAALARNGVNTAPHLIYLPEVAFDIDDFIADVENQLSIRDNVIIAVSEGIRDKDGEYIAASNAMEDKFGHKQLSGAGKVLEMLVKDRINVKVRSVEVNVLQRCAAHLASKTDIDEAFMQGEYSMKLAREGITASMVCLNRLDNNPYKVECTYAAIKDIANEVKNIPVHWLSKDKNDVTKELVDYIYPLIQGEVQIDYKKGVPSYADISHLV